MKRISMMLEKYNMGVFITSSWYSILKIDEVTNCLAYNRKISHKNQKDEYEAFQTISDGIGNRIIGLSSGCRFNDIINLLNDGYKVVALDDMDLCSQKIKNLNKLVSDETIDSHYLFVETVGFITNIISYKIHSFINRSPI
jgi:hypothetical protein